MEQYCTLFDIRYLPQGMALQASLERHAGKYTLWILCMDEQVEAALEKLALANVRLIPLRDLEHRFSQLLETQAGRTRGEYCWTCTPFLPEAIFRLNPYIARVTYLDADTYFFDSPDQILFEFETSRAHVLITDHAYPPDRDNTCQAGRFNVQFMPFRNTPRGREILGWWQNRCVEWCFNRYEDGKFGDQKYLDAWPDLFGNDVHILQDVALTLAPWNVVHLWTRDAPRCLYHFQNLRIYSDGQLLLFSEYALPWKIERLVYGTYLRELRRGYLLRDTAGIQGDFPPCESGWNEAIRRLRRFLRRKESWSSLDSTILGKFFTITLCAVYCHSLVRFGTYSELI